MHQDTVAVNEMEKLFDSLLAHAQAKLLKTGERWVPNITQDDLLQPNDFPVLEFNPEFRYEEGMIAGILSARAAVRTLYSRSCRQHGIAHSES